MKEVLFTQTMSATHTHSLKKSSSAAAKSKVEEKPVKAEERSRAVTDLGEVSACESFLQEEKDQALHSES